MAMNAQFRVANASDIDRLLPLMKDFYAFEKLDYNEARLRELLARLISDPRLGRLILFEVQDEPIGYMVLGFGFSLEFHGTDCLIDEFYVRPEHRSRGVGGAAIKFAVNACREAGIAAIHLEADHFNVRGHEFYLRVGFKDHARHLMTLWV
jgi:GNAT superfamily N-acetyltransferase